MQIKANVSKCQGYGNCVDVDPRHFDLDDDGMVVLLQASVDEADLETSGAAVRSCPVQAIWLADHDA